MFYSQKLLYFAIYCVGLALVVQCDFHSEGSFSLSGWWKNSIGVHQTLYERFLSTQLNECSTKPYSVIIQRHQQTIDFHSNIFIQSTVANYLIW